MHKRTPGIQNGRQLKIKIIYTQDTNFIQERNGGGGVKLHNNTETPKHKTAPQHRIPNGSHSKQKAVHEAVDS